PAKPAFETSQSHRAASCRRYSSSSPPVSAPPPRYRRESSPMAPVDRLLRADRLSQTVPPAACPHQRTPVAPSWPPRIIAVTSEIRTGQRQELFFEAPLCLSRGRMPPHRPTRSCRSAFSRPLLSAQHLCCWRFGADNRRCAYKCSLDFCIRRDCRRDNQ